MEKFTEGPWSVSDTMSVVIHEGSRFGICKVIGCDSTDKANAALIAAAPEMYEMLNNVSEILFIVGQCKAANQVVELLAKARGEK